MAFTASGYRGPAQNAQTGPNVHGYTLATDTVATIKASGYFNSITNQLNQYDVFYVVGSDDRVMLEVTSATGAATVTTAEYTGTAASLPDGSLAGDKVANVADANTEGGIPVIFRIDTAGGATADTDVTVDNKIRVLDVWVVNKAAGTTSDTITVKNGSNAITDAIDISGADKTVARVGTIDDAYHEVAAAGTLKVTETDGGGSDSPAVTVYVLAVRVA